MPEAKDEVIDPGLLKQAQGVTGEVLWLAVRSPPDLAFVAGVMGRLASKNPSYVIEIGKEVIQYVYGTASLCLVYGPCDPCDGVGEVVSFSRSMTRVECFADVSFAPQGGRSVQGVVAMVGGAAVQWESSKQTCVSFSTAEAELLSYLEAQVVAENVGSLVEILQGVPGAEPLHEDVEDDVVTGELGMDDDGFIEAHGSSTATVPRLLQC